MPKHTRYVGLAVTHKRTGAAGTVTGAQDVISRPYGAVSVIYTVDAADGTNLFTGAVCYLKSSFKPTVGKW